MNLDSIPYRNFGFIPLENNQCLKKVDLETVFQRENADNVVEITEISNIGPSKRDSISRIAIDKEEDHFADVEDLDILSEDSIDSIFCK